MKFLVCLAILSLTLLQTAAQNVGIGIATPTSKLTIANTSSPTEPTLGLFDFGTTGPRVTFRNADGSSKWIMFTNIDNAASANSFFKFAYNNEVFPQLTLMGNSKIGINQSLPAHALDVTGDINLTGLLRVNNAEGVVGQVLVSNGSFVSPTWQTHAANPAIGFSANLSSSVILNNGVPTNLTGFSETFDDGGNFNPATGQFTAFSFGVYQFHAQVNFSAPATNNAVYFVSFLKNGITFEGHMAVGSSPPNAGFQSGVSHTVLLRLLPSDVITVQITQFSFETLSIGSPAAHTSVFSGIKVY